MIFVCVGSRNYQFNRLFVKLDQLCEEGIIKEDIFAQTGASTYRPKHFLYKDFISPEEFQKKIEEADIVISHGASGSIMKALNAGKKVIAVTRLEKYGEHIDDHQIQNNEAFAANKYVLSVYNMDDLGAAIKAYYEGTADIVPWENKDPMAIVNRIDDFIKENWYQGRKKDNRETDGGKKDRKKADNRKADGRKKDRKNVDSRKEDNKKSEGRKVGSSVAGTRKYIFLITGMVMGGAERVMATMANEFAGRGNEVLILTLKDPFCAYRLDPRVKIAGAMGAATSKNRFLRLIEQICSGWKGLIWYLKYLKSFRPDAVVSFLTNANLLAVMTRLLFARNVPVVISERADPSVRGYLIRQICKWVYPKADCLVCQSKRVAKYFRKNYPKAYIRIIPNPINEECIAHAIPGARRKAIVAVGRLSNQKNYNLLIECFHHIKNEFPDYTLEIYGQGPEQDKLQEKIKELDMENAVFLMGVKNNVMELVYDAELFVMSSDYEGFPNALIEAMASGLPVISTDFATGVAREVIKDGVNGYVVPVNDKNELASAMAKILRNKELQESMSWNNRKITETLAKDKIIDRWSDVLNKVNKNKANKNKANKNKANKNKASKYKISKNKISKNKVSKNNP